MELKILLLLVIVLICLFPILYDPKPSKPQPKPRQKRQSYAWKGPRTDERINRMLAECIELMKELNVPISDCICPEVRLIGSDAYYAKCRGKGILKIYNEYEYYIEVSGYSIDNTEKSLRNTLIHELLHTVPDGMRHTGEWKKWAKFVSEKTGYTIQRFGGDDTYEDWKRVEDHYISDRVK